MRICFVNTTDLIGGAERCSFDLLRGLRAMGHQTSLVVGRRLSHDPDVHPCHYPAWDWKPRAFLHGRVGLTDTTLATPFRMLRRHPSMVEADVINFHNLHGSYWNFWTVPAAARRMPVILTLHDEWLLTGDCVYTHDCQRWKHGCGSCPQMDWTVRPDLGGRDLTRANHFLKRMAMRLSRRDRVRLVSPSAWLAGQVEHSLLNRFPISVIPNGIDLDLFRPQDKRAARSRFGLDQERFYFLFFANNIEDPRKGFPQLKRVIEERGLPAGSALLLAGQGSERLARMFPASDVRAVGYLGDPREVAACLSAVDCLLLLSAADNLPYTAIEAIGCGCPVLAFDTGGIGEVIRHGLNGVVVPAQSSAERLSRAMSEFAALPAAERMSYGSRARSYAERHYSMHAFLEAYQFLFAEVAMNKSHTRYSLPAAGRADKDDFEESIVRYALQPENQESFAGILNRILPAYVQWVWGQPGLYRNHFNQWQRSGFNLSPNHYYSPVPDVSRLGTADFRRVFTLAGVDMNEPAQLEFLEACALYKREYAEFPADGGGGGGTGRFHFRNGVYESFDAEVLHCMVRRLKPRRIIEVGSGFSTLVTAAACELNAREGAPCLFSAIEPYPNEIFQAPVAGLTELIRTPLQETDPALFATLGENDVLFIDSSHVLKAGSDVQLLYLEILPRLAPGVVIHVHDIFLPSEYPEAWIKEEHIFWNEQYLLQAFLAFNDSFRVLWGGTYMHQRHAARLQDAFPAYDPNRCLPGSFWMRRIR